MRICIRKVLSAKLAVIMLLAQFASGQNLVLPSSVSVSTETVHLSDLLPGGVSGDLRLLAQQIELGRAPKFGSVRAYQGAWVAEVISGHPEISKQISIPDQIVVRRSGFPISRVAIHDAVIHFLQERTGAADLPDIVLQWSGSITARKENSALVVRSVVSDSAKHQLEFRVREVPDEACHDFLVYLQNPPESLAQAIAKSGGNHPATKTPGALKNPDAGPILIEPGRRVRLLMQGDGIQISLSVICLERGRAGQKIRVRAAGGTLVFEAEVVNRDLLRSGPES